MSLFQPRCLPLALAAAAACMSAQAGIYTSADGKFQLSGFGTVGVVTTDNDDVTFNVLGQGRGARQDPTFDVDTKAAVQGVYKFTPTLSATAQVMSQLNAEGGYDPSLDWGFARWQATPAVAVRVGRMAAPLFMVSDFRHVGYANLTVRPSRDVYGQIPYSSVDGADISVQHPFGSTTVTAQLWGGRSKAKYSSILPDGSLSTADVELKKQFGLNLIAEHDEGITLRFGHTQGKMTIDGSSTLSQLAAGATTAANGFAATAAMLPSAHPLRPSLLAAASQYGALPGLVTVNEVDASFTGIGVSVDRDNWVGSAEFTKRKTDSYSVDSTGWYATVGYRFGKFTPYLGLSKLKVDRKETNPVAPAVATFVATASPAAAAIAPGVDRLLKGQDYGQQTNTVGVRWDGFKSAAIKAQWDRIKPDGANGQFQAVQPDYDGKAVNVLTLSVDFVF